VCALPHPHVGLQQAGADLELDLAVRRRDLLDLQGGRERRVDVAEDPFLQRPQRAGGPARWAVRQARRFHTGAIGNGHPVFTGN
jgi:hypothetical protein